jgi:hypothetical protein
MQKCKKQEGEKMQSLIFKIREKNIFHPVEKYWGRFQQLSKWLLLAFWLPCSPYGSV